MLRTIGRTIGSMRRMAGDFQKQFDQALRDSDLDDLRKELDEVKSIDPIGDMGKKDPWQEIMRGGKDGNTSKAPADKSAKKPDPEPEAAGVAGSKPAKAAVKSAKAPTKSSAKAPTKSSAKAPTKSSAKAPTKSSAKPGARKTAAKPGARKTAANPAAKAAKPATKATAAKPAAKSTAGGKTVKSGTANRSRSAKSESAAT